MTQLLQLVDLVDLSTVWRVAATVVDVLIVAYVVYRVLVLLRGTGAAYILVGLLAVGGVILAAHELSLTTLSWLLDHVINYGILIVIIVFQADIRHGLMRMGRRLFLFQGGGQDVMAVEQVVQACNAMARSQTGALIVFEREADLSSFVQQSVELEARPTRELLHNIFAPWPDNPLHDGAVVIRGATIKRVAAVLPLSMRPGLDASLGTRHRAAVGITEESDAISVVVSEQRGVISLCRGGQLRAGLTPEELQGELSRALMSGLRARRWGRLGWVVEQVERAILRPSREPRRPARACGGAE